MAFLSVLMYAVSFASGIPKNFTSPEMVPYQSFELLTGFADATNKDADKKLIIEQVTKEVFTNYSNKIDSLKKYIRRESLMIYIDNYLKDETAKIELKIADKTYVKRYASSEKEWLDTDYSEVAAKLKVRTLDKIKEIMIELQDSTPGLYTMTDEKLRLLEKKVREEIDIETP